MPRVCPRSVRPTPACHCPALSAALLRDLPQRREHQGPGELSCRVTSGPRMLARRHDHAQPSAGFDVDAWVHTALADEPQARQPLEQRSRDRRALADQHQRFGVVQARSQQVHVVDVVVPHHHFMLGELAEARQGAQRVERVVEDRDLHACHAEISPQKSRAQAERPLAPSRAWGALPDRAAATPKAGPNLGGPRDHQHQSSTRI